MNSKALNIWLARNKSYEETENEKDCKKYLITQCDIVCLFSLNKSVYWQSMES